MADPLTALVHAVHLMNFRMSLVTKTLREWKQSASTSTSASRKDVPDEDEHKSSSMQLLQVKREGAGPFDEEEEIFYDAYQNDFIHTQEVCRHVYSNEKLYLDHYFPYDSLTCLELSPDETKGGRVASSFRYKNDFAHNSNLSA